MSPASALLLASLLAQTATPAPPPEPRPGAAPPAAAPSPTAATEPAPAEAPPAPSEPPAATLPPAEELAPPPPLPPPPPLEPPVYGYTGMTELSLALGYSSANGFLGGGGFRRFVLDGVAPGVEASVQTGSGTTIGLLLATLRLAPVRTRQVAVVVTGRTGRVLLSNHDDGWGAGGGLGVIWFMTPHAGIELGYDVLWLLPQSFCADLSACTIQGPEVGLRFAF